MPIYNIDSFSLFWIVGIIELSIILLTHLCHFLWILKSIINTREKKLSLMEAMRQ
jgi:hypothetical protein